MPSFAASLLVFGTSAAVLVLEILAGRVLAPYVGVTLETYTGIIGTVLAGIALGTWVGGRLADQHNPRGLLGPTVLLGGVLSLMALPTIRLVGPALQGGGPLAILILSLVGFFAPATVLSAVTPTVVKLQLSSLDETGTTVGRLSALGTAGAILGTFVTGFVLVAAFPTAPIVLAVGAVLIVTGLALTVWLQRSRDDQTRRSTKSMLAVGVVAAGLTLALPSPCQVESAYFCARVIPDEQRDGGRLLVLDTLRHSYVDLDDPTHLEFTYAQSLSDVLATVGRPGAPLDVLHIGGGGFTLPRYLAATRPGTRSVVLELDPVLVQLARDELGLVTDEDLQVIEGDARLALQDQPTGTYDVVIGDAFGGLAVPWHLTTREFVQDIERTMRPGGVYTLNLIDYPPLAFARAEAATLQEVFEHVAVIAPPDRIAGEEGGNFVLAASDVPLDTTAVQARNDGRGDDDVVATGESLAAFVGDATVLTDAYAPVDQLLTPYNR